MSTREHDPLFEALDRLAGIADGDPVGDRMPDITRRVRTARRRKGAGLVAAATVLAVGGVGVWQALPDRDVPPPPANRTSPRSRSRPRTRRSPWTPRPAGPVCSRSATP